MHDHQVPAHLRASAPTATPVSATVLENHLDKLSCLNESLSNAFNRLDRVGDKLFGCEPPAQTSTGPSNPPQPCLMAKIADAVAAARAITEAIHNAADRLERL